MENNEVVLLFVFCFPNHRTRLGKLEGWWRQGPLTAGVTAEREKEGGRGRETTASQLGIKLILIVTILSY